jgi:hypothetical protein
MSVLEVRRWIEGIKLNGVRIADSADPTKSLMESEFALVTVKILPLLRRRLELKNVKLVAPRIHLWRDEGGRWSFADIFTSTHAVRPASIGRLTLPVSLAADNTVIEDGVLEIDDRAMKRTALIERFNLAVRRFDLEEPFSFSASLQNISRFDGKELRAFLKLEGAISLAAFDWDQAYLRAEKVVLDVDGNLIRGSGGVSGLRSPQIEADLSLPAITPAKWEKYLGRPLDAALPPSRWRVRLDLKEPRIVRVSELEVEAPPLAARASGRVDLSSGLARVEGDVSLKPFPLEAAASYRSALSRFGLKGILEGRAFVEGSREGLAVHAGTATIKGFEGAFRHFKVQGGDFALAASDDFSRVTLDVAGAGVTAFTSTFTEVSLQAELRNRDLRVERLTLKWGEGNLRLKARVLDVANPKEVSIAGSLSRLRWEAAQQLVAGVLAEVSTRTVTAAEEEARSRKPWVRTFKVVIPKRFPDTIGHVHIGEVTHVNFSFKDTDLLWDLRGVTPSLKRVNGDVRVGFGPGRVNDIQAVQSSHKFLTIVFLPYIYMHKMNSLSVLSAATAYPKALDFTRIEGQYSIREGAVTTRFSHVDSPQVMAYAEGTADFGKETVDMTILTRLTGYRAPLPEWWVDELGRPAIGFRVKGDLSNPDLEPRLHKISSGEIEKLLEEGRSRAKARFEAIEKLRTL